MTAQRRLIAASSALVAGALLAACSGLISDPGDEPGETSPTSTDPRPAACDESEDAPGGPTIRRLSRGQYANAVRDLFGVDVASAAASLPDDAGGVSWSVSGTELLAYREAAELVASVLDPAPLLDGCDGVDPTCARAAIASLVRVAYRRPADDPLLVAEVEALTTLSLGFDPAERMRVVAEAIVQSPWFLLRPEFARDGSERDGLSRLDAYSVATRLALLLWDTIPDAALLDAADAGELDTDEGLRTWASRMLADARASEGVRAFASEWLGLRALESATFAHPLFTPAYRDAAIEEAAAMAETHLGPDGEVFGILTANETGIFGTSAFAMATSHPDRTSPTRRGHYVRRVFLCETVPPPPADAEAQQAHSEDPNDEIAFRIEPTRSCSGCHRRMDGIGLGLEQLDVLGEARTHYDGGFAIPGEGFVDGLEAPSFAGPAELGAKLAPDPALSRCFVARYYEWSSGRSVDAADACTIDALTDDFDEAGGSLADLVGALVTSDAFDHRRAP